MESTPFFFHALLRTFISSLLRWARPSASMFLMEMFFLFLREFSPFWYGQFRASPFLAESIPPFSRRFPSVSRELKQAFFPRVNFSSPLLDAFLLTFFGKKGASFLPPAKTTRSSLFASLCAILGSILFLISLFP